MLLAHHNKKSEKLFAKLSNLMVAINAHSDLKTLLETAITKTLEALNAERGSIFLMDANGQDLVLESASGVESKFIKEVKQRLGSGISGAVAAQKRPMMVADVRKEPRFINGHSLNHYKSYSFLSCPLMVDSRVIGVMNVTDKQDVSSFDSEELEFLTIVASHIACCIEKIRLLGQVKELTDNLNKINEQLNKNLEHKKELHIKLKHSEKFASIGKFAANLAHELNNPLDGIMRYTNLSLDSLQGQDSVREYLLEVKNGLNRILNIIRCLLEFSRKIPSSSRQIDVNEALEGALISLSHQAIFSNVKIERHFEKDLPSVTDLGIQQVFSNLIKNAFDAMPQGGVLTLNTCLNNGFIEIRVKDIGCGIPDEVKDQIFEPFFTTKEIDKGLGLGLAMCYEIVNRYNGKISVESQLQKGTIFTVQIPLSSKVN